MRENGELKQLVADLHWGQYSLGDKGRGARA